MLHVHCGCRYWAEFGWTESWTATATDWNWNGTEVRWWWTCNRDTANETNRPGSWGRRRNTGRTQLGWHAERCVYVCVDVYVCVFVRVVISMKLHA